MYRDLLDSHTHTIVSGHAYSTMNDMITAAKERGLELLAITEHAPEMPGTCHWMYFNNFKVIPRKRENLWTLQGVELNILNRQGEIDLPEGTLKQMDVVIASIHLPCYHETEEEAHLEAYLNVMQNPYVNIIGHPDDSRYPVDYKRLVQAAGEHHKLLEMNSSSLNPGSFRQGARENYHEMLKWCMEYQVPIIINSDAHVDMSVGDHQAAWEIIETVKFPEHLIVNTNLKTYFSYLRKEVRERLGIEENQ